MKGGQEKYYPLEQPMSSDEYLGTTGSGSGVFLYSSKIYFLEEQYDIYVVLAEVAFSLTMTTLYQT